MTMEVEDEPATAEPAEKINIDEFLNYLADNDKICFKSQQIGEADLTKQDKIDVGLTVYNKSKLNFLVRFGKYLKKEHLDYFQQFTAEGYEDSYEVSVVLKDYNEILKKDAQINVKNRRYEALKQMIKEDSSYFSDIEMMKRNPLLYEQLVGQYLTQDEKLERDKIEMGEEVTLVKVLMEGIERDDAKIKKREQETHENETMEEEYEDSNDDSSDDEYKNSQPTYSQWGEFDTEQVIRHVKSQKVKNITTEEQRVLKEEFITSMYQSFLDGKDEDFDYDKVDSNDSYDNLEIEDCDEEDKYFDSEEPETIEVQNEEQESEDELDIYMSALNQNPAVTQLSNEMEKL